MNMEQTFPLFFYPSGEALENVNDLYGVYEYNKVCFGCSQGPSSIANGQLRLWQVAIKISASLLALINYTPIQTHSAEVMCGLAWEPAGRFFACLFVPILMLNPRFTPISSDICSRQRNGKKVVCSIYCDIIDMVPSCTPSHPFFCQSSLCSFLRG